jgi:hypothetical protein
MAKKSVSLPTKDPIVESVVGDPAQPRRSRLLRGYSGTSARKGYERLYFDIVFRSFVDINEGDIFQTKSVAVAGSPLDLHYYWVAADADLKWHLVGRQAGFITEMGCPPQTIHTDCPTPTFNVPGCGGPTEGSFCGETHVGCGETELGCGETELGCGETELGCDFRPSMRSVRGRRRR